MTTDTNGAGGLPLLPFAVFDEFGKGADDRVQDYGQRCYDAGRNGQLCRAAPAGGDVDSRRFEREEELVAQGWVRSEPPALCPHGGEYDEHGGCPMCWRDCRAGEHHWQPLEHCKSCGEIRQADSAPAGSATREGDGEVEFFTAPKDMHPETVNLIARFASALAEKLAAAERKYGYSDGWASPDWMDECREKLMEHIAKGDPRDVAAYCAFLWHHGEPTSLRTLSRVAVQEGMVLVPEDVLAACVDDACAYLASDRGWDDYGRYRDEMKASYQAMIAAAQRQEGGK